MRRTLCSCALLHELRANSKTRDTWVLLKMCSTVKCFKWSWKLLSKSPEISSLLCYSVSNLLSMFVPRPSHTGSCPALPMDSRGSGTWIFQMERLVMSHTSYILNSFQIFPSSRLMLFFCSCSTKVRILPFKTTSSRRTQFNRVIPKKLFDGRRERKQFCSASIME